MILGGMQINALDLVDPGVSTIEAGLRSRTNQTILKYGGMCNGVGQLATDVTNLASSGKLGVLRIWSHGFPGGQGVSSGMPDARFSAKGQRAGFALNNFAEVERDLSRLTSCFASGGRVELRGCSVGTGDDGRRFLQELARLWRVDVYAAENSQPIGPLEWVGPVLRARSSGEPIRGSGPDIK